MRKLTLTTLFAAVLALVLLPDCAQAQLFRGRRGCANGSCGPAPSAAPAPACACPATGSCACADDGCDCTQPVSAKPPVKMPPPKSAPKAALPALAPTGPRSAPVSLAEMRPVRKVAAVIWQKFRVVFHVRGRHPFGGRFAGGCGQ